MVIIDEPNHQQMSADEGIEFPQNIRGFLQNMVLRLRDLILIQKRHSALQCNMDINITLM
jgi:hypothetical protein